MEKALFKENTNTSNYSLKLIQKSIAIKKLVTAKAIRKKCRTSHVYKLKLPNGKRSRTNVKLIINGSKVSRNRKFRIT